MSCLLGWFWPEVSNSADILPVLVSPVLAHSAEPQTGASFSLSVSDPPRCVPNPGRGAISCREIIFVSFTSSSPRGWVATAIPGSRGQREVFDLWGMWLFHALRRPSVMNYISFVPCRVLGWMLSRKPAWCCACIGHRCGLGARAPAAIPGKRKAVSFQGQWINNITGHKMRAEKRRSKIIEMDSACRSPSESPLNCLIIQITLVK